MNRFRKTRVHKLLNRFLTILVLMTLIIGCISAPTNVLAEDNSTSGNSDILVETTSALKDGTEIIDISATALHADAVVVSITTPEKEVIGSNATYTTKEAASVDVVITYTLPKTQIATPSPEPTELESEEALVETHSLTVSVGAGLVGALNPEISNSDTNSGVALTVNAKAADNVEIKSIKLQGYDLTMKDINGQSAFEIPTDNLSVDNTYVIEIQFVKAGVPYSTQYTYTLVKSSSPVKAAEPAIQQQSLVQQNNEQPVDYPGYSSDKVSLHVLLPNESSSTQGGLENQYYNALGAGLISEEGIAYLDANKKIIGAEEVNKYLGNQVFVDIEAEYYKGAATSFSSNADWDAYDVMYDMAINGTDAHRKSLLSLTDKDGNVLFTATDADALAQQIKAIENSPLYQFEIEWYYIIKTSGASDNGTRYIKTYHVDGVLLDKQQNVTVEYYDSDKTTLLHTETITKNSPLSFIATSAATQSLKVGTANETYFAGWVDVSRNAVTFTDTTAISDNYQLYAVEKYDIVYDKGLGTGTNTTTSLDIYGANVAAENSSFNAPTGHVFSHWNAYQNGQLIGQFDAGETLTFNHIKTTMVAQYIAGTYNVIYEPGYNFNGFAGTLSTAANAVKDTTIQQPFTYNTAPSIAATNLFVAPNEGYKFAYWSLSNANGNVIDQDVKYHPTTTDVANDITNELPLLTNDLELVANWALVDFNIIYDLDGGSVASQNPTVYTIEDEFSFINPTKEGYTFIGWDVTLVTANLGNLANISEQDFVTTLNKGTTGNLLVSANWVEELPTYKNVVTYKGAAYEVTQAMLQEYLKEVIPTGSTVSIVEEDVEQTDVGTTSFTYEVQYPQEYRSVKLTVSGNELTVEPATLTIIADSYTIAANQSLPNPLGFKTRGLVGKDLNVTLSSLGIDVEITRSGNTLTPLAKYNVDALVENYEFEYENGRVNEVITIIIPDDPTTTVVTTTTTTSTPAATTSTPSSSTTSTQTITDQSTPEQGGTTEAIIVDDETPEVGGNSNAWALINLIASIVGMLTAIFLILSKSKKEDEEEEIEIMKRRKSWKVVSAIVALVSIIVFVLTEDMSTPMQLVDKWTILMLVFALINIVSLVYGRKWHEVQEEVVE